MSRGVSVQGVSDRRVCVLGVSVQGVHVRGVSVLSPSQAYEKSLVDSITEQCSVYWHYSQMVSQMLSHYLVIGPLEGFKF